MYIDLWSVLISMGVPSAVTGLCFLAAQRKMASRDGKRDKLEAARKKNELLLIQGIGAAIALGEATACAIRDGKANGELTKALDYAQKVKFEQNDFLMRQGVNNLY